VYERSVGEGCRRGVWERGGGRSVGEECMRGGGGGSVGEGGEWGECTRGVYERSV
jgi:hypothetical protein